MDNRIIKFRAWLPDDEAMVFCDNQATLEGCEIWSFGGNGVQVEIQQEAWKEEGGEPVNRTVYIVPEQHIMQFTGLQDKNGIDIYEGDIVDAEDRKYIGKIIYSVYNQAFMLVGNDFSAFTHTWEPKFLEVIGNIHQNIELLTQSDNGNK